MERTLRLVLAGIVAGFILFTVASIAYNFTGKITDPSLSKLFRESISMKWFYKLLLINVGTGFIMALFYSMIASGLPGRNILKGLFWGIIVWAIMVHQPIITYLVIGKFTTDLVLSWIMQGLVSYAAAGLSISLIYKE